MISSQDVQFAIQQNDFLTSLDIKSAFNHITVHPSLQPYLGFQVANASYVYIGMPFGLKLAPIVFSKTLQAALAAAKEGLSSTILQYADDILIINKDKQVLLIETVTVKQRLINLGWIINNAKSEMIPKQEIRYLEWIWDTKSMTVRMPLNRQQKLFFRLSQMIQQTINRQFVRIKKVAKLIGNLQFLKFQFQLAAFHLIKLNRIKDRAARLRGWESTLQLKLTILPELFWWHSMILANKPLDLLMKSIVTATMTTDASKTGWGAVLNMNQQEILASATWKKPLSLWPSNQREARAILYALRRFRKQLMKADQLNILTDNQVAVMNIQRKAAASTLALTIRKILEEAQKMGVVVNANHIKGIDNRKADECDFDQFHIS
ncbi:MAG: putative reverse transcriptase [Streblomastix strix]|uniref:Putative reverse transcriptase n=1 Tax=Streblomastix strix TaxID=222440 RepID=A0A5J4UH60_9EUKA|nr:MAG: putative reverse transcriptase [Streblomastix strix]